MKEQLTILGRPVPKGRPRFYNGVPITHETSLNFELLIKQTWMSGNHKRLNGNIAAKVTAYFPIPKSYNRKKLMELEINNMYYDKKPDMNNLIKMLDALNGLAFDDDSQIVKVTGEKFYSYKPRLEIELEEQ